MDDSVISAIQKSLLKADFLAHISKRKGCIAVVGEFPHSETSFFEVSVFVNSKTHAVSDAFIGRRDEEYLGVAIVLTEKAPLNIQQQALRLRAAVDEAVHPQVDFETVAAPGL